MPTPWLGYCKLPDYNYGGLNDNKEEIILIKEVRVL